MKFNILGFALKIFDVLLCVKRKKKQGCDKCFVDCENCKHNSNL